jgi:hypothetical protein
MQSEELLKTTNREKVHQLTIVMPNSRLNAKIQLKLVAREIHEEEGVKEIPWNGESSKEITEGDHWMTPRIASESP